MDVGKRRQGCLMGPDALRTAHLPRVLTDLGHTVLDQGNVAPTLPTTPLEGPVYAQDACIAWTHALSEAAQAACALGTPVFMGGDHAISLGTVRGVAQHAASQERPLFVLWLDAHSDYHTPHTTSSGHLHGTPVGYLTGRTGFDGFPAFEHPVPHERIQMLGLRSVDPAEKAALQATKASYVDMRQIDEGGIARPLAAFLDQVARANGLLHVSLDVDFLDPSVAPAVGTTVPGGATIREAHLAMEMISDSGLLSALDIVELNPFLDERGRTAEVMVDLAASAFGRRVCDRPTARYQ